MSKAMTTKRAHAQRRAHRTRARIHGTAVTPRLTVKRSAKHIYAQLINDDAGMTLVGVSDKHVDAHGTPMEIAKAVGTLLAQKAKDAGVNSVIFDRGAYRFHGRIAALAEGAREGGLTF
ncbi:50S ribosomal protein L18 [Candidatus Uhrbacteria bacterium CG_4_9_14_3_um_filter_50_9]|uniref:Large ribosomal subunit protein uL18 n=1 Tax=Candidatus Uhrbacteria bacterium CG_4_9_14_3_um_filter_50_9 TaxID=1975035 RepID=A0A2M7XCR9_9BACT|nr:MAG: 50S ribosomal protein L18 [Candidatus Uhrbacteria bacterium CG_4_9_14_3_um_filter_50_9]